MSENTIPRVRASEIDTMTMPTLDARAHPGKEQVRGAVRYDPKALLREDPLTLPIAHEGRIVVYSDDDERAEQIAQRSARSRLRECGACWRADSSRTARPICPSRNSRSCSRFPGADSGIRDL